MRDTRRRTPNQPATSSTAITGMSSRVLRPTSGSFHIMPRQTSRKVIVAISVTGLPFRRKCGRVARPARARRTKIMWQSMMITQVLMMPSEAMFSTISKAWLGIR